MKIKLVSPIAEFSNLAQEDIYGKFAQRPRKNFYLRQLRQQEQLDVLAEIGTYITPMGVQTFTKITDATIKIPNIRLMQAIYDLAWNYSVEFNQAPQYVQWPGGPNDAQSAAAKERAGGFDAVYGSGSFGSNPNIGMFWQGVKMFDNTRRDTASQRAQFRAEFGAAGEVSRDRSNPAPSADEQDAGLKQFYEELRQKEKQLRDVEAEIRTLQAQTDVATLRAATRRKKLEKLEGNETARLRKLLNTTKPQIVSEIDALTRQIEALEIALDAAYQTQIGNAGNLSISKMYTQIGHASRTEEGKATSYLYYRPEQTFIKYILYGLLDFMIAEIRSQTAGYSDVFQLPTTSLLAEYIDSLSNRGTPFVFKATSYREYSENPPKNPNKVGVFLKDTPTIHFEGGWGSDFTRLFFDRKGFLLPAFETAVLEAMVGRSFVDNKYIALPTKLNARQTVMVATLPRERHNKVKYTTYDFYNIFSRVFKDYSPEDIKAYTLAPTVKLIVPAVYQSAQIWEELCDLVGSLTQQLEEAALADANNPPNSIPMSIHDCPTFVHLMYTLLGVFPNIEITADIDESAMASAKRAILYQRLNPAHRSRE